jgi:hypothetical protein
MNEPVFVDASAWVAITNRMDQNHNESVRIYRRLLNDLNSLFEVRLRKAVKREQVTWMWQQSTLKAFSLRSHQAKRLYFAREL